MKLFLDFLDSFLFVSRFRAQANKRNERATGNGFEIYVLCGIWAHKTVCFSLQLFSNAFFIICQCDFPDEFHVNDEVNLAFSSTTLHWVCRDYVEWRCHDDQELAKQFELFTFHPVTEKKVKTTENLCKDFSEDFRLSRNMKRRFSAFGWRKKVNIYQTKFLLYQNRASCRPKVSEAILYV